MLDISSCLDASGLPGAHEHCLDLDGACLSLGCSMLSHGTRCVDAHACCRHRIEVSDQCAGTVQQELTHRGTPLPVAHDHCSPSTRALPLQKKMRQHPPAPFRPCREESSPVSFHSAFFTCRSGFKHGVLFSSRYQSYVSSNGRHESPVGIHIDYFCDGTAAHRTPSRTLHL